MQRLILVMTHLVIMVDHVSLQDQDCQIVYVRSSTLVMCVRL